MAELIFLTDFADQAVILPLVAVVTLVLAAQRRWRVLAAWLLATLGVLGTVLALKVACYACGWLLPVLGPDQLALRSPSGHAASAAVTYGGITALLVQQTGLGTRPSVLVALATALGMAVLIGVTRVQLHAHSVSEVAVALGVGTVGALAFAKLSGPELMRRSGVPVMAAALIVMVLFHGRHLPAEAVIQGVSADMLRQWIEACRV